MPCPGKLRPSLHDQLNTAVDLVDFPIVEHPDQRVEFLLRERIFGGRCGVTRADQMGLETVRNFLAGLVRIEDA